jgi:hypothetical protein
VNFAWGRIPPDLVEETSPFQYPLLTVSAAMGKQDGDNQRLRFHQFSGTVLGYVEVHLSYLQDEVTDFASWPDAVVDAMFSSLNDPKIPNNWGAGLVYPGLLNFEVRPPIFAGSSWRITVGFPVPFKVVIQ